MAFPLQPGVPRTFTFPGTVSMANPLGPCSDQAEEQRSLWDGHRRATAADECGAGGRPSIYCPYGCEAFKLFPLPAPCPAPCWGHRRDLQSWSRWEALLGAHQRGGPAWASGGPPPSLALWRSRQQPDQHQDLCPRGGSGWPRCRHHRGVPELRWVLACGGLDGPQEGSGGGGLGWRGFSPSSSL